MSASLADGGADLTSATAAQPRGKPTESMTRIHGSPVRLATSAVLPENTSAGVAAEVQLTRREEGKAADATVKAHEAVHVLVSRRAQQPLRRVHLGEVTAWPEHRHE